MIDGLRPQDYSEEFDKIRQNRIAVSFHKYGPAEKNMGFFDGARLVDPVGCIDLCLKKYHETKNTEYLVDLANYAMFGYMYPEQSAFFKATTRNESAGIAGISYNQMMEGL